MAEAVAAAGAPRVSRLDRRKARTRQALIEAAVRLIAEGRGDRASIAEITPASVRGIIFECSPIHFLHSVCIFCSAAFLVSGRFAQSAITDAGTR